MESLDNTDKCLNEPTSNNKRPIKSSRSLEEVNIKGKTEEFEDDFKEEGIKLGTKVMNKRDLKLKLCINDLLGRLDSSGEKETDAKEIKSLKKRLDKELTLNTHNTTAAHKPRKMASGYIDRLENLLNNSGDQSGLVSQLKGKNSYRRNISSEKEKVSPIQPKKVKFTEEMSDEEDTPALKKSFKKVFPNKTMLHPNRTREIVARDNVFDSLSDEEVSSDEETAFSNMVIPSKSMFARIWEIVMLFAVMKSLSISPYMMAFNDRETGFYAILEVITDLLFICDIILSFFIEVKEEGTWLTTNKEIALYYLENWLLIDMLCSIPTGIISYSLDTDDLISINKVLRISRIYRMTRWFRIFRLTKLAKMNHKILPDSKIMENLEMKRLVKISFLFVLLLHNASCLFIFLGRYPIGYDFTWIDAQGLRDADDSEIYYNTLYFSLTTILGIGYGDITSTNSVERLFNIVFMVVGAMFFSFTISAISKIFYKLDEKAMLLKKKFGILSEICKEYKLTPKFKAKLVDSLKTTISTAYFDKHSLINSLPHNLKSKIIFTMYKTYIDKMVFLRGQTREFIAFVLPILSNHQFKRGDSLLNVGEFLDEAFFVVNGTLSIHLAQYFDNIEIARISENYHFGEILMQLNEQSPYEIKAKSKLCNILILKKKDFISLNSSFDDAMRQIMRQSVPILEKIEQRRNLIMEMHDYATSTEELQKAISCLNYFILDFQFKSYYTGKLGDVKDIDFIMTDPTDIEFFTIIKHLKTHTDPRIEVFINYLNQKYEFPDQTKLKKNRTKSLNKLSLKPSFAEKSEKKDKIVKKPTKMEKMAEKLLDYTRRNSNIALFTNAYKTMNQGDARKTSADNTITEGAEMNRRKTINLDGLKEELDKKREATEVLGKNTLFSKSKSIFGEDYGKLFKKKSKKKKNKSIKQVNINLYNCQNNINQNIIVKSMDEAEKVKEQAETINSFLNKTHQSGKLCSDSGSESHRIKTEQKEPVLTSFNNGSFRVNSNRNSNLNSKGQVTLKTKFNRQGSAEEGVNAEHVNIFKQKLKLDNFVEKNASKSLQVENRRALEQFDEENELLLKAEKILFMLEFLKK